MAATFDPRSAAAYGAFIDAAYVMYEADHGNPRPGTPQNWPAGYRLTAYIQMDDFFGGRTFPQFYGFIAENAAQHAWVLAMRGTASPTEWFDNAFNVARVPFAGVPGSGRVGRGWATIYRTFLKLQPVENHSALALSAHAEAVASGASFGEQVAAVVGARHAELAAASLGAAPAPQVVVTAHSLGAALLTLYVMESATKQQLHTPLVYTFASPLVGDAAFAAAYGRLAGVTTWRIVNKRDAVPTLPPFLGYVHVGQPVPLDSAGVAEATLGCAHAMNTYQHLLDPPNVPLAAACDATRPPTDAEIRQSIDDGREAARVLAASAAPDAAAREAAAPAAAVPAEAAEAAAPAAAPPGGLGITGIDVHVYQVKDTQRAVAFYRDVLGLAPSAERPDGAEFELGDGSTFGLWNGGDRMPWIAGNGVMFAVGDFDAAVAAAKARGVKVMMQTETPVCFMALAEDSEGNHFLLHKRKNG
ncbi:MAG TPA: VOC family protein [Dongiaceae bacterium]|nr:VOC family protein [Dongiaceae bacterium]